MRVGGIPVILPLEEKDKKKMEKKGLVCVKIVYILNT